jgi:hypothetical protein
VILKLKDNSSLEIKLSRNVLALMFGTVNRYRNGRLTVVQVGIQLMKAQKKPPRDTTPFTRHAE